jgi:Rrf2 family protein
MLTNKGKYGLKAAVYLAGMAENEPALVSHIAAAQNIPKKFLDTILGELRNAGLVRSKKGRNGGYFLARDAHHIMAGDIVRALDGPIAPIRCVSKNYYERCSDCSDEETCAVYLVMSQVRGAISEILDKKSLAEMRAQTEDGEARPGVRV